MIGSLIITLLQIYCLVCQQKNFENRPIFDAILGDLHRGYMWNKTFGKHLRNICKNILEVVTCKIKHFYNILRPRHSRGKSTALKHFCKTFLQMLYFTCNHGLTFLDHSASQMQLICYLPIMRLIVVDSCRAWLCRPGGASQRPNPVLHVGRCVPACECHVQWRISHRHRWLVSADSLHGNRVEF